MGQFDFLDCGDLTWNIEKKLVSPVDRIGPIDLYQVTHHGMAISNHPTLLQTIAPTVTIMNNGPAERGDAETVQPLAHSFGSGGLPTPQECGHQRRRQHRSGPDRQHRPRRRSIHSRSSAP